MVTLDSRPIVARRASWREVRRIAFSPDMRFIVALDQRNVTLYETATFHEDATLNGSLPEQLATGYPEGTGGLSFSPAGDLLAVGTMQGTVQLWSLKRKRSQLAESGPDWASPPPRQ